MAVVTQTYPGALPYLMVVYRHEWADNRAHDLLLERGHAVDVRCPPAGDPVPPSPAGFAGIIIGGSLDNVLGDDRLPYVDALIALTCACIEQDVPFLGFCFGAQVLAAAAGGRVLERADRHGAFGYRPIRPATPEGRIVFDGLDNVYHLHFHGFEAPPGATPLADGLFPSNAFRIGAKAFAFQFHPEIRADQIEAVLSHLDPDALARPGADPAHQHLEDALRHDGAVHAWMARFMDEWTGWNGLPCPAASVGPERTGVGDTAGDGGVFQGFASKLAPTGNAV